MPDLLHVHRELLQRWRKIMNLVGPGSLNEHYQDAERGLRGLAPTGRWVDLGSGAGFPGIVLAAMFPDLVVELVDSRQRRCAFLDRVLTEAQVPPSRVTVRCLRAEELEPAAFDGVVSRAFAPPPEALEHAARLLVPGGTAVLFLQDDGEVPVDARFEVFHVERYAVDGRWRKAVALRLQA